MHILLTEFLMCVGGVFSNKNKITPEYKIFKHLPSRGPLWFSWMKRVRERKSQCLKHFSLASNPHHMELEGKFKILFVKSLAHLFAGLSNDSKIYML